MELDFQRIFKEFNKLEIDYLVVGGLAVNLHGIPRMTYDMDLMISLDQENIKRVLKKLSEWGYRPKAPINPIDLLDEEKRTFLFPFISIHDLIKLKETSGRKQDISDIEHLKRLLER